MFGYFGAFYINGLSSRVAEKLKFDKTTFLRIKKGF